MTEETLTKYAKLKEKINRHDYAYHVQDQPEITDFEYDQLYAELLALESKFPDLDRSDSPSQRVGHSPLSSFQKFAHRIPMISLANTYSAEDLIEFDSKVKKFLGTEVNLDYYCEPKFDGLAIELVYENGILHRALTRGDGTLGEDVTQNIKTIRAIPLKLKAQKPPTLLEVRGEVLILKKDFQLLNETQQEMGLPTFANPRNAAAGTIRQLDSKIAQSRPLHFFSYAVGAFEGIEFEDQAQLETYFEMVGLPVCSEKLRRLCKNIHGVVDYYLKIEKERSQLAFDIDGIVTKVNNFELQKVLGQVAKSPRWATAAKYKPQQVETIIKNIIVQVGRTGALTPVAIMQPAKVDGVIITNATLHNQEEINRKDIRIGDSVILQRAGDVIPEVVSVIKEKRKPDSKIFLIPETCPECGSPASRQENEVISRCTNADCPAIIKGSLVHFIQRRAMNIDKIGEKLVETLYNAGLVKSFSDFYRLSKQDLLGLERQGEKSAQNVIESIQRSKQTSLSKLIFALGIRFVGEQTAKSLADHFLSIEKFLSATEEELLQIPDIGPKVAESILSWLQIKKATDDVRELVQLGLQISQKTKEVKGILAGQTFLITGTLPIKRQMAQDLIEQNGGKLLSGVSSKLDYLVVGENPGSKLEKARALGVEVVQWEELQKKLKS